MTVSAVPGRIIKKIIPGGTGKVSLLAGEEVFNLLEDTRFIESWEDLCNACAWATVFQRPSFVATWYRTYKPVFLPVLVKAGLGNKLTGLLTLAINANGLVTGAGANQAEYQVWLTEDAGNEDFIKEALIEIYQFLPKAKLRLKYIPAGAPLNWTKNDPLWHKRSFIKTSAHPLMIIDDVHLTNELRKKNRKEKINRLKRLGHLVFERIVEYAAFVSIFDELAIQSDFRKGAMYNKAVFKKDPSRKKFLLELFKQNNLHVTVLKLNDKIIACNAGIGSGDWLHLQGINAFAADFAKYSPGIIHFLLLGKLLLQEGVQVFDLTPGADDYKNTLATDYREAHSLSIGNTYHGFNRRIQSWLNGHFKKMAAIAGMKPVAVRKWGRKVSFYKVKFAHITSHGFTSMTSWLFRQLKRQRNEARCWAVPKDLRDTNAGLLNIQKNNLKHLLDIDQHDIQYCPQEFLADAMRRLEEGGQSYTWSENGILLGCAWLNTGKPAAEECISLSGLYCHPGERARFPAFLRSVVAAASTCHPGDKLTIIANCYEQISLERAGFLPIE